jgi:hypothetical protein
MRNAVMSGLLAMSLFGCASHRDQVIAQDKGNFVRLESDPNAARTGNTHPARVTPERLQALLATIMVQSPSGALFGKQQTLALFDPDDLSFLAPALSDALAAAKPIQRAVFYLEQRGRLLRPEVTTGAVSMQGDVLAFTLGHYRRTDVLGVVQNDRQADNWREVRSNPMFGVYDVNTRISAPRAASADGPRTLQFVEFATSARAGMGTSGNDAPLPQPPASQPTELEERLRAVELQNTATRALIEELKRKMGELDTRFQSLQQDIELIKRAVLRDTKKPTKPGPSGR